MVRVRACKVPYKGATFALVGAMSGEVDVVIPAASAVEPYVKNKRMRVLAVLDTKRLASMPDVPTSAEAGMPQLQIVNWYVLTAPAATPRAIVDKWGAEMAKVLAMADIREKLSSQGMDPFISTPDQFATLMKADFEKFARIIKTGKIKLEQ